MLVSDPMRTKLKEIDSAFFISGSTRTGISEGQPKKVKVTIKTSRIQRAYKLWEYIFYISTFILLCTDIAMKLSYDSRVSKTLDHNNRISLITNPFRGTAYLYKEATKYYMLQLHPTTDPSLHQNQTFISGPIIKLLNTRLGNFFYDIDNMFIGLRTRTENPVTGRICSQRSGTLGVSLFHQIQHGHQP